MTLPKIRTFTYKLTAPDATADHPTIIRPNITMEPYDGYIMAFVHAENSDTAREILDNTPFCDIKITAVDDNPWLFIVAEDDYDDEPDDDSPSTWDINEAGREAVRMHRSYIQAWIYADGFLFYDKSFIVHPDGEIIQMDVITLSDDELEDNEPENEEPEFFPCNVLENTIDPYWTVENICKVIQGMYKYAKAKADEADDTHGILFWRAKEFHYEDVLRLFNDDNEFWRMADIYAPEVFQNGNENNND